MDGETVLGLSPEETANLIRVMADMCEDYARRGATNGSTDTAQSAARVHGGGVHATA